MNEIIPELQTISDDARKTFGALSAERLNWRPAPDAWSVGQCFEHLIKSNELLFDEIDRVAAGDRRNSFWENWSPLTGFGGGFLIKSLRSDQKKFKIPTPKIAPPSAVDAAIIEKFADHQAELIGKIERCANVDRRKIVVTSPFLKLMTYRFDDGLTIIVEHEKRHFRQAERVTQTENFPAA
ncbi:MAG: DinB family protein [Acidobacteria bacterium]|nr:DinB family protein [Acidobacteriota bacterium]